MAAYDVQFVDTITDPPAVRLDLGLPGWNVRDTTTFPPPELNRAVVSTLLVDGDRYPAAAYHNRMLNLVVRIDAATDDLIAAAKQRLYRELDRPANILRYRPGTSAPVFFRTYRAGPDSVTWDPTTKEVKASIPAEPFALGLRETQPTATVYNDPAEGADLNANPFFETDASGWLGQGGTISRSTVQAHEGTASLLLTPDGVSATAEARTVALMPVTAGQVYRASAWLRCAVARNINCVINWHNGAGTFLSSSTSTVSVAANTWTLADFTATAFGGATQARLIPASLGSTPAASHLCNVDEARLRLSGGVGGMCLDLATIKGDVDSPLYLQIAASDVTSTPGVFQPGDGRRTTAIAVRRGGTPSAMPAVLQAESMTPTTDTTLQPASGGSSGQFARTTFVGTPSMQGRLTINQFPAAPSRDARGQYRTWVRCRKSVAADVIQMLLHYTSDDADVVTKTVAVPSTVWRWVYLGLISMPLGYDPVTDGLSGVPVSVQGLSAYVYAARVSGTGNLDVDTIMHMPADDRMCLVTWPQFGSQTAYVVDATANQVYAVGAAGEIRGTLPELVGGAPSVSPGVANRIWVLRDVGPEYVAGDDITASVRITPYYWPRYLDVRPVAS